MQVDSDGSGSIEFLEFLLLMGRILKDVPTDADLRDVFTGKLQLAKTRGSKPCSGHEGDHQGAGTDLTWDTRHLIIIMIIDYYLIIIITYKQRY